MIAAPTTTHQDSGSGSPAAPPPAVTPAAAPPLSVVELAALRPIDRAALVVGTALVAWSRRGARRAEVRLGMRAASDRELHSLRRMASRDRSAIEARRDLGINQLLR